MPETPDFKEIARRIAPEEVGLIADIADALRQVWNARGAADLEQVDAELSDHVDVMGREREVGFDTIARAVRALDR